MVCRCASNDRVGHHLRDFRFFAASFLDRLQGRAAQFRGAFLVFLEELRRLGI